MKIIGNGQKDANKLLIEEAEKAGHALYKEYLSDGVTIDPFLSYQNMMMLRYKEGNTEIIFPRTKDNAGWFDDQASSSWCWWVWFARCYSVAGGRFLYERR